MLEVELKFPHADLDAIRERLASRGAQIKPPQEEVDLYFAHPGRDFAATDEALRLRRIGQRNRITYKGPKLDAVAKTREEIELSLGDGEDEAGQWRRLLESLGFRPVAEVRKRRQKAIIVWQGAAVEASLDQVEGVGNFVELEQVVDAARRDEAQSRIGGLAADLGLAGSIRQSYLELLLKAQPLRR